MEKENKLGTLIIGCGIEVHRELGGPGLLEDVYEEALCDEFERAGLPYGRQIHRPIIYKGRKLRKPLYIDLLVEDLVIVECKATSKHQEIFESQLLTYLRLSGLRVGYILNFGMARLKDGIRRVINDRV